MKKLSKLNPRHEHENLEKFLKDGEVQLQDDKKKNFFNKFDYIFVFSLLVILTIQFLSSFDSISWQLSSMGRILLINILPYYDWKFWKNEECILKNIFTEREPTLNILNCNICEDITEVDVHDYLEEYILEERYINIDIPVILTKGLEKWPKDSKFIEELKNEEIFSASFPCSLASNIIKTPTDISTILSKQKYFDQFFIHFRNCELDAIRTFRKYVFRPEVLPSVYSPTIYNWLIWNKNYNTTNFKPVDLVEKVTVIGQLFGSTYFKLIPRKNCEIICPSLSFALNEGEILIFTSLWDLEYRPNAIGENMAIVIEY